MSIFGGSTGSPPFNPNAPDPREQGIPGLRNPAPQAATRPAPRGPGLGLAQPAQPAAPQALSALEKIGLSFGDAAAGFRGQQGPSQRLMQLRRQQFEQREQDIFNGYRLLEAGQKFIDAGTLAEAPARYAQVRKQFAELYGEDSLEFVDSTLGKSFMTPGMMEELMGDEVARVKRATLPVGQLREWERSPARWEILRQRADRRDLDNVVRPKIQQILASKDPKVRATLRSVLDDKQLTSEDLRGINDQLPEQLRFKPSEIEVIARNEDAVAQQFPKVFATSDEFAAARKRAETEASQIRIAQASRAPKAPPDPNKARLEQLTTQDRLLVQEARSKLLRGQPLTDADKTALLGATRTEDERYNVEDQLATVPTATQAPAQATTPQQQSLPLGQAAKGKPSQGDIERVANQLGTDDPADIKAALRAEGFAL